MGACTHADLITCIMYAYHYMHTLIHIYMYIPVHHMLHNCVKPVHKLNLYEIWTFTYKGVGVFHMEYCANQGLLDFGFALCTCVYICTLYIH